MVMLPLWIDTDQADFGLAKTSSPWPVSSRDFRLARTTGHPLLMPIAIPLPATSSSWLTVSRTMSSYSSISNVTRLEAEGSEACDAFAQVMTRRVGGETSMTLHEFDGPLVIGADVLPFRSGIPVRDVLVAPVTPCDLRF